MEYNFHDINSPNKNNNNINNSQLEKNNMQNLNYNSYHKPIENVGYNYIPIAFNNPSNIYKKPYKGSRVGNISNNTEEDYIQINVKSFNNKNQTNFQNMNYSNISNNDFQNVNYSGDEMGNFEVMEHQHENYHNRSPDSLLRYNNKSQSPEDHSDLRNQNANNTYNNNKNNYRGRENSPPDNTNDPYFKK